MHWLRWAERIQAIAQIGLTYTRDPYDAERYPQLRELSVEIVSTQSGVPAEQIFGRDELPPLSVQRNSLSQVTRLFAHYDNPDLSADFD